MSAAKFTPGPWRAVEVEPVAIFAGGQTGKPHWEVLREIGRNTDQSMKGADGRTARFPTEAAARAAIAKAVGESSCR